MDFEEWTDHIGVHPDDEIIVPMRLAWDRATKIEREACATTCRQLADRCLKTDGRASPEMMQAYEYAAEAINARSNA